MFSGRDLYPNMANVVSTDDNLSPELGEQLVLTKGDGDIATVATKEDKNHLIMAIVAVVAVLFAFGLVR